MLPLYLLVSPATSHCARFDVFVRFRPSVVPRSSCQPNEHDASVRSDASVGSFPCDDLARVFFFFFSSYFFYLRFVFVHRILPLEVTISLSRTTFL